MSKDPKERDYISVYRKSHNLDPGPKYNVGLDMTKKSPILDNPPRIKILKDTVPTHLEEIQRESKKTPGPGKYETKKKVKIYGTYTYKETGCTFTNEA